MEFYSSLMQICIDEIFPEGFPTDDDVTQMTDEQKKVLYEKQKGLIQLFRQRADQKILSLQQQLKVLIQKSDSAPSSEYKKNGVTLKQIPFTRQVSPNQTQQANVNKSRQINIQNNQKSNMKAEENQMITSLLRVSSRKNNIRNAYDQKSAPIYKKPPVMPIHKPINPNINLTTESFLVRQAKYHSQKFLKNAPKKTINNGSIRPPFHI